jgi:cell division septal protein FtsQ
MAATPEPSETLMQKVKAAMIPKWFWILLAILVVAGMWLAIYDLWKTFRGKKE